MSSLISFGNDVTAEDTRDVTIEVSRFLWTQEPDCQEHVRSRLQRELAMRLAADGLIPTGLPQETVVDDDDAPYERVTWTVPVRRPL